MKSRSYWKVARPERFKLPTYSIESACQPNTSPFRKLGSKLAIRNVTCCNHWNAVRALVARNARQCTTSHNSITQISRRPKTIRDRRVGHFEFLSKRARCHKKDTVSYRLGTALPGRHLESELFQFVQLQRRPPESIMKAQCRGHLGRKKAQFLPGGRYKIKAPLAYLYDWLRTC